MLKFLWNQQKHFFCFVNINKAYSTDNNIKVELKYPTSGFLSCLRRGKEWVMQNNKPVTWKYKLLNTLLVLGIHQSLWSDFLTTPFFSLPHLNFNHIYYSLWLTNLAILLSLVCYTAAPNIHSLTLFDLCFLLCTLFVFLRFFYPQPLDNCIHWAFLLSLFIKHSQLWRIE